MVNIEIPNMVKMLVRNKTTKAHNRNEFFSMKMFKFAIDLCTSFLSEKSQLSSLERKMGPAAAEEGRRTE